MSKETAKSKMSAEETLLSELDSYEIRDGVEYGKRYLFKPEECAVETANGKRYPAIIGYPFEVRTFDSDQYEDFSVLAIRLTKPTLALGEKDAKGVRTRQRVEAGSVVVLVITSAQTLKMAQVLAQHPEKSFECKLAIDNETPKIAMKKGEMWNWSLTVGAQGIPRIAPVFSFDEIARGQLNGAAAAAELAPAPF